MELSRSKLSRRVLELCARRVTSCGRAATRVMAGNKQKRAEDVQPLMKSKLFQLFSIWKNEQCILMCVSLHHASSFLFDAKTTRIQHTICFNIELDTVIVNFARLLTNVDNIINVSCLNPALEITVCIKHDRLDFHRMSLKVSHIHELHPSRALGGEVTTAGSMYSCEASVS